MIKFTKLPKKIYINCSVDCCLCCCNISKRIGNSSWADFIAGEFSRVKITSNSFSSNRSKCKLSYFYSINSLSIHNTDPSDFCLIFTWHSSKSPGNGCGNWYISRWKYPGSTCCNCCTLINSSYLISLLYGIIKNSTRSFDLCHGCWRIPRSLN